MKVRRVCPYDGLDCENPEALAAHVARTHGIEADQLVEVGPDPRSVESALRSAGMTVGPAAGFERDTIEALVKVRAMRPGGYL